MHSRYSLRSDDGFFHRRAVPSAKSVASRSSKLSCNIAHCVNAMSLAIRRATLSDLDLVAPLFDAYRRFYAQAGDMQRARDFLQERLQRDESAILLAELDGHPAGFTQLYPMFSSVRTARIWILNDLFVDDGARR